MSESERSINSRVYTVHDTLSARTQGRIMGRTSAKIPQAKPRNAPNSELLARHYRQLREARGTVLLGEPTEPGAAPKLERAWFVDDCPLDPERAVEVIRTRHGFASRTAALRALRDAAKQLRALKHPDAEALADLP